MNWNLINTVLLAIVCFFATSSFLLDVSITTNKAISIFEIGTFVIYAVTLGVAGWALAVNRKIAKSQTEPFIDIKLESVPTALSLVRLKISNLGTTSAFNITFTVTDIESQNNSSKKVIEKLTAINFMKNKLSYLSKGDFRYSQIVDLYREDSSRGFTNQDFFDTQFTIRIRFEDINKTKYKSEFVLVMNELIDKYEIGKDFESQLIHEMKVINTKLTSICTAQTNFGKEYEKIHRGWTEADLKRTLAVIETKRFQNKWLNQPDEETRYKRPSRKQSINELRKQNK